MILDIRKYGDPLLRKKMPPVASWQDVIPYIPDMIDTMYDDDGIGLSANQAGIEQRFFLIGKSAFEDGRPDSVFIDPEILAASDEEWDYEEGCLSVPGIREVVIRPYAIKVRYTDETGQTREEELRDLAARVFQHELDHLNGIFFVDRISAIRRSLIKNKLKAISKQYSPIK
jgi:peptide deformylase